MAMTEERLAELEKMVQEATAGPWAFDLGGSMVVTLHSEDNHFTAPLATVYEGPHSIADGELMADARTALLELSAEVRRLRACLETLAHITSFSGDHPNSHVWAYIMGEALQADPQESPFWQEDEVPHD